MAAQYVEGRWFERPDGIIFRMDDPDHIKRMLAEGWHEVEGPHTQDAEAPIPPLSDALPADPDPIEAVEAIDIPATVDAFIGTVPGQQSLVKPLKRVRRVDEDAERRR